MMNLFNKNRTQGSLQTSPYSTIGLKGSLQTSYPNGQLVN